MATHIRIFSDIHLDFDIGGRQYTSPDDVWAPVTMPEDPTTILIIAGDLWTDNKPFKVLPGGKSWISEIAKRFEHVIIVLGNHDYWGLSLQTAPRKAKEAAAALPNVSILEQDAVVVSEVKFVGGTLWTDYGRNPVAMEVARATLSDYKYITFGDSRVRRKVRPLDMFEVHRQTARFIFNNCRSDEPGQPVIVVTHMAPNERSIDPAYVNAGLVNHAYYTDLSSSIRTSCQDVKLWVHGHMHTPVDYDSGVRVFSNPRGYERYEGTQYNPICQLKISDL